MLTLLFFIVGHNFIMDNYAYNTDWMLQLPRQHVQQICDEAKELIDILDNAPPDIYHQVGVASTQARPLCRGDHWCTCPCVARDPWDETILPKLSETQYLHEWTKAHGVQHGHPFYHNFCEKHMAQFDRVEGEWVPCMPRLERNVARSCVPVEQQEGPLYYVYSDIESQEDDSDDSAILLDLLAEINARA